MKRRLKFKKQPCSGCGRTTPAKTHWGLCEYLEPYARHRGCWDKFKAWAETQPDVPDQPDHQLTRVLIDRWLETRPAPVLKEQVDFMEGAP